MDETKDTPQEAGLEARLLKKEQSYTRKITLVDTIGNISYPLITGSILDYYVGLNFIGIVASRASATVMNSITGGPYGLWREKTFKLTKTNKKSRKIRKMLVDILAFNTFQTPIYAVSVAIGSLVSEGNLDMEKVQDGMTYIIKISPFIGPTLGWYMDFCRKLFGLKCASEGAYKGNEI